MGTPAGGRTRRWFANCYHFSINEWLPAIDFWRELLRGFDCLRPGTYGCFGGPVPFSGIPANVLPCWVRSDSGAGGQGAAELGDGVAGDWFALSGRIWQPRRVAIETG